MTLFPGDVVKGDDGREFKLGALMAYQGKADCTSVMCRRRADMPGCMGYHCPRCDLPCSMYGHKDNEACENARRSAA